MSTLPPPPGGSPSPEQLAHGEKDGQAVVIWSVGMFCIFGWDWLLCLPKEIHRVWRRKLSYMTLLYLFNRYFGLLEFSFVVVLITTPITNALSVDECRRIFRWQPVGAVITTLISQAIMGSRVWALYGRSTAIATALSIYVVCEFAIHSYTLTRVYPAPQLQSNVPVPCVAIGPTGWLIGFWVIPLGFDTITFLLTLVKTIQYWKNETDSLALTILFRDGLFYFAAIFSMNLINVVLFLTQNTTLQAANLPATLMLNILMSCRLVLNLRGSSTEMSESENIPLTNASPRLETWKPKHRSMSGSYMDTTFSQEESRNRSIS